MLILSLSLSLTVPLPEREQGGGKLSPGQFLKLDFHWGGVREGDCSTDTEAQPCFRGLTLILGSISRTSRQAQNTLGLVLNFGLDPLPFDTQM